MSGRKDDGEKPRMDLLPGDALLEVGKVATFGAGKYGARNWELGLDWGRLFAAQQRHMLAWLEGEDLDPETGLSHLAHAAWGCLALLAATQRGMGTDDRRRAG